MFLREITMRQLRIGVDGKILKRAEPVVSRLVSLSPDGVATFFSSSITTWPGKRDAWTQHVQMLGWDEALSMEKEATFMDRANIAIFGDVKVSCDDPSFLYAGYRYILTQLGALYEPGADWEGNTGPEERYPKVRNPNVEGVVCKHLSNALYIMTMGVAKVASLMKEMVRTGDLELRIPPEKEVEPETPESGEEEIDDEKTDESVVRVRRERRADDVKVKEALRALEFGEEMALVACGVTHEQAVRTLRRAGWNDEDLRRELEKNGHNRLTVRRLLRGTLESKSTAKRYIELYRKTNTREVMT